MNSATATKSVVVSPKIAQEYIDRYSYDRQRALRPKTVALYADKMASGHWSPGTQIKFAVVGTGKNARKLLVDGQHRLHAVIESGKAQEFVVTEVACADDDELARLYYTTDRNALRGYADIFSATGLQAELGLTKTQMNSAAGAVRFIGAGFLKNNQFVDEDALLDQVREYASAIVMYFACVSGADRRVSVPVLRSAVAAVGLVTFRYSADIFGVQKVEEFWDGVALDDGLRSGDPRKVANIHLMTTRMPNAGGNWTGRLVSPSYQARYIANCFNAWVSGQEYKTEDDGRRRGGSKVYDASAPIKILGTPWK